MTIRRITIATVRGPVKIRAYCEGPFAVHGVIDWEDGRGPKVVLDRTQGYTVTHIPTGRMIGYSVGSRMLALIIVDELIRSGINWNIQSCKDWRGKERKRAKELKEMLFP